jgi:hypothetical protein
MPPTPKKSSIKKQFSVFFRPFLLKDLFRGLFLGLDIGPYIWPALGPLWTILVDLGVPKGPPLPQKSNIKKPRFLVVSDQFSKKNGPNDLVRACFYA